MENAAVMPVRFSLQALLANRAKRDKKISQSELSRRSAVSLTTINAMVLNKTAHVSRQTLDALCDVPDVEPGELLERQAPKGRMAR